MSQQSFVRFDEKHCTPKELAKLWGLHPETIRQLFHEEQGVILIGTRLSSRAKRKYLTMRIPASVAERVHRRMQNR